MNAPKKNSSKRDDKLKEALRDNLQKRKHQARARRKADEAPPDPENQNNQGQS